MKKLGILFFIFFFFLQASVIAATPHAESRLQPAKTKLSYHDKKIEIFNSTPHIINLRNGKLFFYFQGKIDSITDGSTAIKFKEKSYLQQSHNQGNKYELDFNDSLKNPLVLPQTRLFLNVKTATNTFPHQLKLFVYERVQIPLQVSVANENWVTKFKICNNTTNSIPLKDIEFKFNYATTAPTNIWGNPWAAWRVANTSGTEVTLLGGTPWTPDLAPDPNCNSPLTIEFNASPSLPLPTGPFVFKAEGGVSPATGSLSIRMPVAPAGGLLSPNVTITGPNTNQNRALNWGETWLINNLTAGNYTITAANVNNNEHYYTAAPVTAMVDANSTATAAITYTQVATTEVSVSLSNSPEPQQQITLSGQNYSFTKTVSNNSVIALPADSYTVTAMSSGYSVIISPNPLIVPIHTSLSLSYQQIAGTRFVGFMESWKEGSTSDDAALTNLGNLPSYLNVVHLAFIKPDAVYSKGSLNYENTGLQFQYPSLTVLKFAVARLHRLHPSTKVLVSIGGPTYTNWSDLNPQAIADFVVDYGLDGVDINYLPPSPGCTTNANGTVSCQIDAEFKRVVDTLRTQLPRPFMITVTAPGVGAYGEAQWQHALPQNSYTGIMLPLLRSTSASSIDMINVMAYDLGSTFNATQSLAAYSNFYSGPISMGVSVPPEAAGGHVYNLCEVVQLTEAVKTSSAEHNHTAPAMMLWAIAKRPTGTVTPTNPSAQMIATTICKTLGLSDCNHPILLPSFKMQKVS